MPESAKPFGRPPRRLPYGRPHKRRKEECLRRACYLCELCVRRHQEGRQRIECLRASGKPEAAAKVQADLEANPIRMAEIGDHIKPHRGNERLMKDPTNYQALCEPCHKAKTATEQG